jgi:putative oxidoreductase
MDKIDGCCAKWSAYLLSVLRLVVAVLFIQHGTQKLFGFPAGHMPDPLPLLLKVAGVVETAGGFLFLIGLWTRPTAFILCGEMAVAYFMAHQPRAILPIHNAGEVAVLYCFVFLFFVGAGAGPWSIDHAMRSNARTSV